MNKKAKTKETSGVKLRETQVAYLRTISKLTKRKDVTTINDIAAERDVTSSTARAALLRLSGLEPPLVDVKQYGHGIPCTIKLTDDGRARI